MSCFQTIPLVGMKEWIIQVALMQCQQESVLHLARPLGGSRKDFLHNLPGIVSFVGTVLGTKMNYKRDLHVHC